MSYTFTVRHGSSVERQRFDALDEAISMMRSRADEIVAEGALPPVSAIRDYEPGQRVAARLGVSTGGIFRGREAGLDVMGDGRLVPYTGAIRRRPLETGSEEAYESVRRALR